jgi:hypothetical protein
MRDRFLHLATPYERVYYGRRPAAVGEARTYLAACRALVMDPARP